MGINFPVIVGIIVRRHDADGVDTEAHGMLGELDGRESVGRADMHDDRHPPAHSLNNLLGDLLAFVDLHYHALAVRAQRKKSVHAGVQIEIDDRVRPAFIDGAIVLERYRHGHQNTFDFFIAWHKFSFRICELSPIARIQIATLSIIPPVSFWKKR